MTEVYQVSSEHPPVENRRVKNQPAVVLLLDWREPSGCFYDELSSSIGAIPDINYRSNCCHSSSRFNIFSQF
ncbi:MAG: hypothetical protein EAZ60_16945 [Oscillatoriales cyanobacterium]|nr:MAG: hypothetical protein EAZ79_13190 [Oscillatoriales cyanobacterium]TAF54333.1 MAG: hypothetical protein EAZ60_16945 [Oscillatoriales cyanobacterium]